MLARPIGALGLVEPSPFKTKFIDNMKPAANQEMLAAHAHIDAFFIGLS